MKEMEKFLNTLKEEGYSENSIKTYRRALKKLESFMRLHGFDEGSLDLDALVNHLSMSYRSGKSIMTVLSAIRQYLLWKGIRVKRFRVSFEEREREFRLIDTKAYRDIEVFIGRSRKEEMRLPLMLSVYLGIKPSQILRIRRFSLKELEGIPVIEEGNFKRFITKKGLEERLRAAVFKTPPGERVFNVNYGSLKVALSRISKRFGFNLSDFLDNYAFRLLERRIPVDIVVEYSGISLSRASYIYRVCFLKSKAEILEGKL